MQSRRNLTDAITNLGRASVIDVRATFEMLRDDLAATLAYLAAEVLLHQEACNEAVDAFPAEVLDTEHGQETVVRLEPPLWSLLVEDFQRLAAWLPKQRLARFGEADAVVVFRDRVMSALRPALVELERYGVLSADTGLLDPGYWNAEGLYDLAVRYEGFTLALTRAIQTRFRRDREILEKVEGWS